MIFTEGLFVVSPTVPVTAMSLVVGTVSVSSFVPVIVEPKLISPSAVELNAALPSSLKFPVYDCAPVVVITVVLASFIVTAPAEILVAVMIFPFVMFVVPSCITAALSVPVMLVVPFVCTRFA